MNSKSMYIFLKVLEIFRIFPTKDNQYRIASSILNKWNGLCDDSQSVYVVSVQWWEEWCDYISLRVNNDNANNPYYTRVVDDSQNKSNVSANDKKIVKNLLTVESNTPVKSTMNSDDNNMSTALTYDNFYKYFNGNDCLFGTNVNKLKRRINEIDKCENLSEDVIIEKASCYSELGKDSNGNKKPNHANLNSSISRMVLLLSIVLNLTQRI